MAFLYRMLPPRPTFPGDMSPEEGEAMQRHFAYWQDLLQREVAVVYGPVQEQGGTWGLAVLDVEDEQAARGIGEGDPAVESGTCTFEVAPMDLVRAG